jgi:hypothetical protein
MGVKSQKPVTENREKPMKSGFWVMDKQVERVHGKEVRGMTDKANEVQGVRKNPILRGL